MIKKFWQGETPGLTAAAVVIGLASLASRVVGVLRDRFLAGTFGAGHELDAYYAAFRVPDLLYNLIILGALSAGFIPVFSEYLKKKGEKEAWELAGQVVSVVALSMGVLCLIMAVAAPVIVPPTVPGFSPEQTRLTIELSRIMFLSPFLLGLSAVMGGILQSMRRFVAFSLAPVLYNLGIIFGTLVLAPRYGLSGVAWGVVLGAVAHVSVQAIVVRGLGLRHIPLPSFKSEGVCRILLLMAPRTIGLAVAQVNLIIMQIFASTLPTGSVAIFNLANNLQAFPVSLIGISYAVAVFPSLSASVNNQDFKEFISTLRQTIRKIAFLIIPVTALFFLLRPQAVRLVLGAGQFDWDDTIRTANVLGIFLLSLFSQCLVALLVRAFYAMQDTKTPLVIGVVCEVVNIIVAIIGYHTYGILGLAAAFTIATTVNACLLWIALRKHFGSLGERTLLRPIAVSCIASAALIGVGYPIRQFLGTIFPLETFIRVLLQASVTAFTGLLAFVGVSWLLKSEEIVDLVSVLNRKLFKSKPQVQGAEEGHGM
ncbi:murein biosynthesis integral membrane protein MurJ [Candidatus Uhrbacteria bacterium]|nr:murein biosynthesis integral membrane protein MurJ [Candidatus Uhrbacteria bacterium]